MSSELRELPRVETAALFLPLLKALITLLRGLSPADWERPTIAGAWSVRDVASHLLDGDLRKLSLGRDRHVASGPPVQSYRDLVRLIDDLNATGVAYARRLSPRLVVDLLETTGVWVADFVASLPADGDAVFSVAWAGEQTSPNWMDTGREYTERWHHQMQIREAVGAPPLFEARWLSPLLDLSVRALPVVYAPVEAAVGTQAILDVVADVTHSWTMIRGRDRWSIKSGRGADAAASLSADAATFWKILYNALSVDEARRGTTIRGEASLVEPMLRARSVMV